MGCIVCEAAARFSGGNGTESEHVAMAFADGVALGFMLRTEVTFLETCHPHKALLDVALRAQKATPVMIGGGGNA